MNRLHCWSLFSIIGIILSECCSADHAIECQDKLMKISCTNKSYVLTIISAMYGRKLPGKKVCAYRNTNLSDEVTCHKDVAGVVKNLCEMKNNCAIPVDRQTLSDPCQNTYKYLEIFYQCEDEKVKNRRQVLVAQQLNQTSTLAIQTSTEVSRVKILSTTSMQSPTPSLVIDIQTSSMTYQSSSKGSTTSPPRSSSHSVSVSAVSRDQRFSATTIATPLSPSTSTSPSTSNPASKTTENKTVPTHVVKEQRGTMKLFHFILSFHIIHQEKLQKHPANSLVWFFLGLLAGLLIVIFVLLYFRIRKFQRERKGKPDRASYSKQKIMLDGPIDENIELHPKQLEVMEMESQCGETA